MGESISFVPAVVPNEGGMDVVGRMMSDGETTAGARLRHDTLCATCGEPFTKGDLVDIRLAADWDAAVFAHRRCGMPPPPIDPATRHRGFGMRSS